MLFIKFISEKEKNKKNIMQQPPNLTFVFGCKELVCFFASTKEDDNEKDETIDFCFIESRLRSPKDDSLMVVVGWALKRRRRRRPGYSNNLDTNDDLNSNWLLDGIDWQDFRDEFRPGIGREEWERICG